MDIIGHILDELALIPGVLVVCYLVVRVRRYNRRNLPRRPEVGAGYLSSFADKDTGFPNRNTDDKR